jgi:hypothetical protein
MSTDQVPGVCAAPGRIWTTGRCAAFGRVYCTLHTRRSELQLDMSEQPIPLVDVSTPQGPELHSDLSSIHRPVMHMDVSTSPRPELT